MGFSMLEYWSGLPCPPSGDLPHPGVQPAFPASPALAGRFLTMISTWEAPTRQYLETNNKEETQHTKISRMQSSSTAETSTHTNVYLHGRDWLESQLITWQRVHISPGTLQGGQCGAAAAPGRPRFREARAHRGGAAASFTVTNSMFGFGQMCKTRLFQVIIFHWSFESSSGSIWILKRQFAT